MDKDFEIFDGIFISYKEKKVKPELFDLMLSRIKFKPEECLYFDDRKKFVEEAKKRGIKAFVYTDAENLTSCFKKLKVKPFQK